MRTAWSSCRCPSGPSTSDEAPRRVHRSAVALQHVGGHPQRREVRRRGVAVEQANDDLLAVDRRHRRDARVDLALLERDPAAPVLRLAAIGDVHPRQQFQPRGERRRAARWGSFRARAGCRRRAAARGRRTRSARRGCRWRARRSARASTSSTARTAGASPPRSRSAVVDAASPYATRRFSRIASRAIGSGRRRSRVAVRSASRTAASVGTASATVSTPSARLSGSAS